MESPVDRKGEVNRKCSETQCAKAVHSIDLLPGEHAEQEVSLLRKVRQKDLVEQEDEVGSGSE